MADTKNLILIIGANGGIGYEVARQLLQDASNYVLLGSRSTEKGEAAVKDLQSQNLPGTVELVQLDVSSEDSIAAAAKAVESKHDRLDALVNNAGISIHPGSPSSQMTACFITNAVGTQLTTDYFAPLLRLSPHTPRIINVSSGAGSIGLRVSGPHETDAIPIKVIPYRASKAAMNMVLACQWWELKDEGFKVFTYCPGRTASNLSEFNTVELGSKPTSEGAEPIVEMLGGKRDAESGRFVKHGGGEYPW